MKLKLDYKKCHEGLWNWLAKNPDKRKGDWPGWKTIKKYEIKLKNSRAECFACEVGNHTERGFCTCPVSFGIFTKSNPCLENKSYYMQWFDCRGIDNEARSKYAQLIANGWK
jgi:hypothetical protein